MDNIAEVRTQLSLDASDAAAALDASTDPNTARQQYRLAASTLYEWRNLEAKRLGVRGFRDHGSDADTLEDLLEIRGSHEHETLSMPRSIAAIDVFPDAFPLDDLFPSTVTFAAFDVSGLPVKKQRAYAALLGREVADVVRASARFLQSLAK